MGNGGSKYSSNKILPIQTDFGGIICSDKNQNAQRTPKNIGAKQLIEVPVRPLESGE